SAARRPWPPSRYEIPRALSFVAPRRGRSCTITRRGPRRLDLGQERVELKEPQCLLHAVGEEELSVFSCWFGVEHQLAPLPRYISVPAVGMALAGPFGFAGDICGNQFKQFVRGSGGTHQVSAFPLVDAAHRIERLEAGALGPGHARKPWRLHVEQLAAHEPAGRVPRIFQVQRHAAGALFTMEYG